MLGLVHRLVSVMQQGFRIVAVVGIERDADTCADRYPVSFELQPAGGFSQQALYFGDQCRFAVDVGNQHDEFVATDARHRVGLAHDLLEIGGDLGQ